MQDPQNNEEPLDIPVDIETETPDQLNLDATREHPPRNKKPWDAKMDAIKAAAKAKAKAKAAVTETEPSQLEKDVRLYLLPLNRDERRSWLAKQRRVAGAIRAKALTAKSTVSKKEQRAAAKEAHRRVTETSGTETI